MGDYDHTHDGPSGRWRPSSLIKVRKEDVCYGPDCPGRFPRKAVQGGALLSITALTPITATIGSYSSIITTVRGGKGPYSYYINTGSLPIGLTINLSTANISGTLTVASVTATHGRRCRLSPSGVAPGRPCTLPSTRYGPTSTST